MGYRVLYHSPRDTRGGKRRAGNAPQGYLVLYHQKTTGRHPENQLQYWLRGGYLVLYHRACRLTPLQPPFLHVGIASREVVGFMGEPRLLGSTLAGLTALRTGTCSLTVTNTGIRNKESAAELAVLGQ